MKIIDKKIEQKVYSMSELEQGEVYKDNSGHYLIATDEHTIVDLLNGAVYSMDNSGFYKENNAFTLVNAVLEIQ